MAIRVNGTEISDAALQAEMQRLYQQQQQQQQQGRPPQPLPPQLMQAKLLRDAEQNAIGRLLLEQEAAKRFKKVPSEQVEQIYAQSYGQRPTTDQAEEEERRRRIKNYIRIHLLLDEVTRDVKPPTDDDVHREYQRRRVEFIRPELLHASHIVKHLEQDQDDAAARAQLEDALEQLRNGTEFAEVAASCSDCPDRGGDLGQFPRGQMVEEFEKVVFNLQNGEISEIFRTSFGLHIAKLHERTPAEEVPFEELRERLGSQMANQRQDQAVESFIDTLREAADIARD